MNNINFTNREKLTKCLSLELKPVGNTRKTINDLGIIEADIERNNLRPIIIKAYDSFIKKVIDNVLSSFDYNWEDLYAKKMSIDKREYEKLIDKESEMITELFKKEIQNLAKAKFNSAAFTGKFLPSYVESATDLSASEKAEILRAIEKMGACQFIYSKIAISRETSLMKASERVFENFDRYLDNIYKIETFIHSKDSNSFKVSFPELESCTLVSYYSQCLRQCDIDAYNSIISGLFNEDGTLSVKGYNGTITELNLAHKQDKTYEGPRYKKIDRLYKQVLFPSESTFSVAFVDDDTQAREIIAKTRELVTESSMGEITSLIRNAEPNGITVTWNMLGALSKLVYDNHAVISNIIKSTKLSELEELQKNAETKSERGRLEKQINNIEKSLKKTVYTMQDIMDICSDNTIHKVYARKLLELRDTVVSFDEDLDKYKVCDTALPLRTNTERVQALNNYYSAITEFSQAVNIIRKASSDDKSDVVFYNTLDELTEILRNADKAHNMVRTYVTKKVGELAKKVQLYIKAETCWTKADGDDRSDREISILKRDGKFYFATRPRGSKGFKYEYTDSYDDSCEILAQSKGQKAMMILPKWVFNEAELVDDNYVVSKNVEKPLIIPKSVYEAYTKGYFKTKYTDVCTEEEHNKALVDIINVYKTFIDTYEGYKKYNIITKPAEEYNDIGSFFDDVDNTKFIFEWKRVKTENIDKAVASGNLLMFLITNRELYRDEKRNKHTYAKQFLSIISDENMAHPTIQLNADPQIYWRDAIIPRKVTHPKGSILVNEYDVDGNKIPANIREELYRHLNGKIDGKLISEEAKAYKDKARYYTAKWDIVKDERFTREQFSITMSYTVNREIKSSERNTVSEEVSEILPDSNVLTVVRGYDHLIYCRITDKDGEELYSANLDTFDKTNYRDVLLHKTFERRDEKKNWSNEITIKEIRNGYIDKAISEIIRLAKEYKAVILVEKLDDNYKDKAAAFDNQVFKSFETRLRTRLLGHTDVNAEIGEEGSPLIPMQFINSKVSDNAFQNGILFKLNSAYTKSICPFTGFTNVFDTSNINSIAQKRNFLSKFDAIKYDNGFKFSFDYKNFPVKMILNQTNWVIDCTKPCTEWDSTKKKYVYSDNASNKVCMMLDEGDIDYKNSNMLELIDEGLAGKYVDALYNLFINTINRPMVKKCDKVDESYYSSPVIDTTVFGMSQEQVIAMNMAKKFKFHLSDNNTKNGDYSENWLNYNIG